MSRFAPSDRQLHDRVLPDDALRKLANSEPLIWMSSRNAAELCGLYVLIAAATQPLRYIDVALTTPSAEKNQSFGHFSDSDIVSYNLFGTARVVTDDMRTYAKTTISKYGDSNMVRRIEADSIRGFPLDFYDEMIIAQVGDEWRTVESIAADVMYTENSNGVTQVEVDFLVRRAKWLAEQAQFELEERGGREYLRNRCAPPVL